MAADSGAEVPASDLPFVVVLGEHRPDQAHERPNVGEDDFSRSADLTLAHCEVVECTRLVSALSVFAVAAWPQIKENRVIAGGLRS